MKWKVSRNPPLLHPQLRISFERVGAGSAPWVLLQPMEGPAWRLSLPQWQRLSQPSETEGLGWPTDPLWQEAKVRGLLECAPAPASSDASTPLREQTSAPLDEPLLVADAAVLAEQGGLPPAQLQTQLLAWSEVQGLEWESLPEARYRCEQCGESCRAGYEVGALPAMSETVWQHWVPVEQRFQGLDSSWQLLHHDGACVQLDPQTQGCLLHAAGGPLVKPRACRDFPLLLSRLPGGRLRLHLQWECTRLHRTGWVGACGEGERLERLLGEEPGGWEVTQPSPVLTVGDGRLLPLEAYLAWEQELLRLCDEWSPSVVILALPGLVEGMPRRTDGLREQLEQELKETAEQLQQVLEARFFELAPLFQALLRQGEGLEPALGWLSRGDKRRVYRAFVMRQLRAWQGGELPSLRGAEEQERLYRAWLKNRIFGLSLLRAPSLYVGALELGLRYLLAVSGREQPPEVKGEPAGAVAQRCLVAVEHVLRQENLVRAYEEAYELLNNDALQV